MVGMEQWADITRMHRVEPLSIRGDRSANGLHRKTIRRALANARRLQRQPSTQRWSILVTCSAQCKHRAHEVHRCRTTDTATRSHNQP